MLNYSPTILSSSLCCRLDGMIFTFSQTFSDAMAAAHSWSSLVTSLSNNPPSIRITCGVTCTVLSNNERLLMFMRESSCWTRFERSNRSKGTGSFLEFLSRLLPLQVTQDVLGLGVHTYPTISSREAFRKCLCPETRTLLDFCLIGLLLFQSFIELGLLAEAFSILVFVTHPVLDYHVVAI